MFARPKPDIFQPEEPPHLKPQYEEEPEGIAVHVRVRPLNSFERSRGDHECVHCDEATQTVKFVTQPAKGSTGVGGGVVKALRWTSSAPCARRRCCRTRCRATQSPSSRTARRAQVPTALPFAWKAEAINPKPKPNPDLRPSLSPDSHAPGKTFTISGDDASEPNSEEAPAAPSGKQGRYSLGASAAQAAE
eukprot:scaffold77655_cov64-Phaeocystis_antarctica.AAC.6